MGEALHYVYYAGNKTYATGLPSAINLTQFLPSACIGDVDEFDLFDLPRPAASTLPEFLKMMFGATQNRGKPPRKD